MPDQTFQDILSSLDLGYPDPSGIIDPYVEGNRASATRIREATAQNERDPRNIVDKLSPIAELIGFLADRTSGSKTRRRNALPIMAGVQAAREGRIDSRKKDQRQKYLDRLANEELLGGLRGKNFNAQMGGAQIETSQIGAKTRVATGEANRQAQTRDTRARITAAKEPSPREMREQRVKEETYDILAKISSGDLEWSDVSLPQRAVIVEAGMGDLIPQNERTVVDEAKRDLEELYDKHHKVQLDGGFADAAAYNEYIKGRDEWVGRMIVARYPKEKKPPTPEEVALFESLGLDEYERFRESGSRSFDENLSPQTGPSPTAQNYGRNQMMREGVKQLWNAMPKAPLGTGSAFDVLKNIFK